MPLTEFEKNLLKHKSYKDKVIDAIGRQNNLSLSALFSSMIGPAKQDANNPLKALFYNDRHDDKKNTYCSERPAASEVIINLLKQCTAETIDFDNYLSMGENSDRIKFQYENLITHKDNILGISSSFFESCIDTCEELFVPSIALKGKFEDIIKEINEHSPPEKINIKSLELRCQSDNNTAESLFFLIIEIEPHSIFTPKWLNNENEKLPNPVKDENNRAKLLSLCDYIMIVPKGTGYYLCPLYTLQVGISAKWLELSSKDIETTLRINKKVKFKLDSEINIAIDNGYRAIEINSNTKPIFHIFVFDNQMKLTGGKNEVESG